MRNRSHYLRLFALLSALGLLVPSLSLGQTSEAEISFWSSVKDSKDEAEIRAYLQAYPDGVFAALAKIRLKNLGANEKTTNEPQVKLPGPGNATRVANKAPAHDCDRLAANPGDEERVGKGVQDGNIIASRAIAACADAVRVHPDEPRFAYQLARARYAKGSYETANVALRQLAENGYAIAMVHLGFSYAEGNGLQKDYAEAIRWYRKAAAMGSALALNNIGAMYHSGRGVSKDVRQSSHYIKKAAELGDTLAMSNLGARYLQGTGLPKNPELGVDWIKRAAEQGDRNAFFNLAWCYESGTGIQTDKKKAAAFMLKALKADMKTARERMTHHSNTWSAEFRRELQSLLKEEGHYTGPIDGDFGPATIAALGNLVSSVDAQEPATRSRIVETQGQPGQKLPAIGDIKKLEKLD